MDKWRLLVAGIKLNVSLLFQLLEQLLLELLALCVLCFYFKELTMKPYYCPVESIELHISEQMNMNMYPKEFSIHRHSGLQKIPCMCCVVGASHSL